MLSLRMEANKRPTVFKWWGRRPAPLVRAFLSLVVGADPGTALKVAAGEERAVAFVRSLARGLKLIDPFSGSGLIPIEASKLGFEAVGQDVNPYAYALAMSASDLCTGACSVKVECLWNAIVRAWQRSKGLWCRADWCIVHVLLARCPPCIASRWVSSKRGSRGPREILLFSEEGGLEWKPAIGEDYLDSVIELPGNLPLEAEDYVAYAVEVYNRVKGRRWISLLDKGGESIGWKRFLEETSRIARKISDSMSGVDIPLMEETRRLYRRGRVRSDKLYSWRQNASYIELLRWASLCRLEAKLAIATASPSTSLLAIYYQPLAKVNPGMVVKSYWLPRNPVELNPFSHSNMPGEPYPGVKPVGRGTLISVANSYTRACEGIECVTPPTFIIGDSRKTIPGKDYDILATDPPYPGLHTYKDLSLFYYHASHLAGETTDLGWEEIDTRDLDKYKSDTEFTLRKALSKSKDDATLLLFISSSSSEGLAVVSDILSALEEAGVGIHGIYPVLGEAKGLLGRASSKLIYVVTGRKGSPTSRDALTPLMWTENIVKSAGLTRKEQEYSIKLSQIFLELLKMKMKAQ